MNQRVEEEDEALFLTVEGSLPVHRPLTKGQIKDHYEISYKTLKKWLEPIIEKLDYNNRRLFRAKDLRLIRELLDGVPLNAPSAVSGE